MKLSRRQLLESLGIAAAGLVTAGYSATARGFAANETITVGCIGTGGRCRRLMQSLATIPGVKIAAVCDIWHSHRCHSQLRRGCLEKRSLPTAVFDRRRGGVEDRCRLLPAGGAPL